MNFIALLFLSEIACAQTDGDYQTRSNVTGNWNGTTTWQKRVSGAWTDVSTSPASTDGVITITSGATVTVTAGVTVDQVTISSGGQVTVNGGTLTVADGTGTDLTVSGILKVSANSVSLNTGASMVVNGIYEHNRSMTFGIPTATWNTNSSCLITIEPSNSSTFVQSFYNLTFNYGTGTSAVAFNTNVPTAVNGKFSVITTGSTGKLVVGDGATAATLTVNKFEISGGILSVGTGSGAHVLTVTDSLIVSGGTLRLADASNNAQVYSASGKDVVISSGTLNLNNFNSASTNAGRLFLSGNLTINGGTLTNSPGISTGSAGVYFNGTGSQTFTYSGGTLSTATGGVGLRFYYKTTSGPTGLNETYSGSSAQTTINGTEGAAASGYAAWPITGSAGAALIKNVTINNSAGVTNSTTKTVNTTLTLSAGTYTITNALTTASGATIVRTGGSLSTVPTFTTSTNVTYGDGTYTTAITTGNELPSVANGTLNNLAINVSGGVTLNTSAALGSAGVLTLTNGKLTTTSSTLTINNTAPGAVTGYSSSSYVNGPLDRKFAASTDYTFPVGGVSYYPITLKGVSVSGNPVVRVTMAESGATTGDGSTLQASLLSARNWKVEQISGTFTSATLEITESAALTDGTHLIGKSNNNQAGNYVSTGTCPVTGGNIITSPSGQGTGYYAIGVKVVCSTPATPSVTVADNCGSSTLSTSATGTLSWSTGATTSSIAVTSSGTYTVTQTVSGCVSAAGSGTAAPISIPAAPSVTVTDNCNGTSTLSTTATGTLLWSTTETTSVITVTTAGTYSVTQTVNTCTSPSGTGTAAPKTTPATPTVAVTDNCGSSTLSTTATGTLSWSTGATTTSISVTASGIYTVIQTVNSCTSAAGSGTAAPKTIPSAPSVSVTNNCDGTSFLSTTATGALSWSTGASTTSITVTASATYTVTQTVNACTSAAGSGTAAPKTTPATPSVTVTDNCGSSTLSTSATGTLSWSTGATTSSITVTAAGSYSVTQTVSACTSAAGTGTANPISTPTTYYSKSGQSNPTSLANWWSNTNGTGCNPADFTNAAHTFIVQSGHSYTMTSNWTVAGTVDVQGTLTVSNTSTARTFQTGALNVSGTFSIDGSSGTGSSSATVTGNFTQNGGTVDMNAAAISSTTSTLNIGGDFSQSSGTITESGGNAGLIVFTKSSGTQNYSQAGTISNAVRITKNAAGTLLLGSDVTWPSNITISSGTLDFGSTARTMTLSTANGTLNFSGSTVVMNGSNAAHKIKLTGTNPTTTFPSTWTHGTGDVFEFATTGTTTNINQNVTFNHLINSGVSNTVRIGASTGPWTVTVNGDLTLSAGTFVITESSDNHICTVKGNLIIQGGTFNTCNTSGNTSTLNLEGNFTMSSGAFNKTSGAGTSIVNFIKSNGSQTLSLSSSASFAHVWNVGNGTTTNSVQLLSDVGVGGSSSFNVKNNAALDLQTYVLTGTSATFTAETGSSIITLNSAGLTSSGASGSVQVTGTRTYKSDASYEFQGTNTGTFTTSASANTVNNLTINRSGGVILDQNLTVNGVLKFTSGVLTTGSNTVSVSTSGSVSRTSGHVNGNLKKIIAAAINPVVNFEVGDVSNYTPVQVSITGTVSASTGSITAKATSGDHPQVASSGINSALSVNRYWTLTNNTSIPGLTSYSPAFTYLSGDNDASTTPSNYVIRRYNSSWATATLSGTPTSASAVATGLTAFGDFAVGESTGAPAVSTQPSDATTCTGNTSFTAASTSIPAPTIQWQEKAPAGSFTDISNGGIYSGVTTGTLTLTGATTRNGYQYRAVFTNINGTANSNAATLTVNAAPSISVAAAPVSQSACVDGTPTNLTLTATGTGLTYQWYNNGTTNSASGGTSVGSGNGGQTNTYTPNVSVAGTTYYYCVVSGTCSPAATSSAVAVTVNSTPSITTDAAPLSQTVCAGGTPTQLTISASGGGLSYQWYNNGTTNSVSGGTSVGSANGGQTNNYTPDVSTAGTTYYYCVVSGTCSPAATSSAVAVTVNPAATANAGNPQTVCAGGSVTLAGSIGGAATSSTWSAASGSFSDASSLTSSYTPGISSGTVTLTLTTNDPAGPCAVATSSVVITVNANPSAVTVTPATATICSGGIQALTASGGSRTGVSILSENFNGTDSWTKTNNSTGGITANAAWTLRQDGYQVTSPFTVTFHSNDNTQFYLSNSHAQGSGSSDTTETILQSPSFSTLSDTSATVSFYHYFKDNLANNTDTTKVEYSTDNTNWTVLQSYSTNTGSESSFAQQTLSLPAGALNHSSVYIRFKYKAHFGFWWAIDNVSITGSEQSLAWSPSTGLYTNAGATVAYAGTSDTIVYAKPTATTTYTVTATSGNGCIVSNTSTITVQSTPTAGVIAADQVICSGGNPALFTSTTNGSGDGTVSYRWESSVNPFSTWSTISGANDAEYDAPSGLTATTKYRRITISTLNGVACESAATSAVTVTVNSLPTITGAGSVCIDSTKQLTGSGSPAASNPWVSASTAIATVDNNGLVTGISAGTSDITYTNNSGCSNTVTVTVSNCLTDFNFTVKLFLQGYYLGGGKMSPMLHLLGAVNSTAVDTVTIELHDANSPYASLYSFKGILASNGNLVCTFPLSASGNSYYIVIKHRNSLETWSANAVTVSAAASPYDFTTGTGQAYGSVANLGGGVYGIYSGDIDANGYINASDRKSLQDSLPSFNVGVYDLRDVTGDGFVDEDDYRMIQNNAPLGVSMQRPN